MFTEFPIPTAGSGPTGITTGPDGALWFTETRLAGNKIGRITTAGVVTEFSTPTAGSQSPGHHDGSGRRTVVHRSQRQQDRPHHHRRCNYRIPDPHGRSAIPKGITTGPDGALWFTEETANQIGRITTAGVVDRIPDPHGQ